MKKQTAEQPKVEYSPIAQKAFEAARMARNARQTYAAQMKDIEERVARMQSGLDRARSYSEGSIGREAANVVTWMQNLSENMRFDILVRAAADAEKHEAVLEALRPFVTEAHEVERLAMIEAL